MTSSGRTTQAVTPQRQHISPTANRKSLENSWATYVLIAAAVYNLAWGAFAILSPLTIFRWCGFDPLPAYPELWQCIGMIVGVYGVGYAIAACDPDRHWPIVLVGLLGKVCGPIGFVASTASGRFPWSMGWTILMNDLIWWLPFGLILWHAARTADDRTETTERV